MPTQTQQGSTVYQYIEFSTGPPLVKTLRHPQTGDPLDLTSATGVTISIAWSMPRGSYYTSPRNQIVTEQACTITDATNGVVSWTPGTEVGVDALTPPGTFLYQHNATFDDGTEWILPAGTYEPLTIRSRVGGRAYNPGGS